jgi:hypothetical protein
MIFVVDTNVCVVANGDTDHASPACVRACSQRLLELKPHQIAIDDGMEILREYKQRLHTKDEPRDGHAFYRWLVTNLYNQQRCVLVPMAAFPADPELSGFDMDDRKFVQVALAHAERPPILNAVDSDWRNFEAPLATHGIRLEFLCPEHA